MRSTPKKSTAKKPKRGKLMKTIHIRVTQDIHSLVTDMGLNVGKPTSYIYRELIEQSLAAGA